MPGQFLDLWGTASVLDSPQVSLCHLRPFWAKTTNCMQRQRIELMWVHSECTSYLSVISQISNYWYGLSAWHTTKMVPGCFPQKARWIAVPSQSHQVPTPSQLNATYCDSTSLERQTIYQNLSLLHNNQTIEDVQAIKTNWDKNGHSGEPGQAQTLDAKTI